MKLFELVFVILFVVVINFLISGLCWPYVINTWLVYGGKVPSILFWQGGLIGFVPGIGQLALPLTLVTWILMIFLN